MARRKIAPEGLEKASTRTKERRRAEERKRQAEEKALRRAYDLAAAALDQTLGDLRVPPGVRAAALAALRANVRGAAAFPPRPPLPLPPVGAGPGQQQQQQAAAAYASGVSASRTTGNVILPTTLDPAPAQDLRFDDPDFERFLDRMNKLEIGPVEDTGGGATAAAAVATFAEAKEEDALGWGLPSEAEEDGVLGWLLPFHDPVLDPVDGGGEEKKDETGAVEEDERKPPAGT